MNNQNHIKSKIITLVKKNNIGSLRKIYDPSNFTIDNNVTILVQIINSKRCNIIPHIYKKEFDIFMLLVLLTYNYDKKGRFIRKNIGQNSRNLYYQKRDITDYIRRCYDLILENKRIVNAIISFLEIEKKKLDDRKILEIYRDIRECGRINFDISIKFYRKYAIAIANQLRLVMLKDCLRYYSVIYPILYEKSSVYNVEHFNKHPIKYLRILDKHKFDNIELLKIIVENIPDLKTKRDKEYLEYFMSKYGINRFLVDDDNIDNVMSNLKNDFPSNNDDDADMVRLWTHEQQSTCKREEPMDDISYVNKLLIEKGWGDDNDLSGLNHHIRKMHRINKMPNDKIIKYILSGEPESIKNISLGGLDMHEMYKYVILANGINEHKAKLLYNKFLKDTAK